MKVNWRRYARLIKQGLTDYRWFLYYLQRATLDPRYRHRVASVLSKALPKPESRGRDPGAAEVARRLAEDGLVVLDGLVAEGQVEDMVRHLNGKLCADPHHPAETRFPGPQAAPRSCFHCHYAEEDVLATPHLVELANHPRIVGAIERVFGCKPTISNIGAWWVFHEADLLDEANADILQDRNLFHRDVDDWVQVKLFIYLTDVDQGSGPHAYIRGSHRPGIFPAVKNVDVTAPDFPYADRIVRIAGKGGTAFLENSFGMHRGVLPETGDRLMLAVSYTLFPLPFHQPTARVRKQRNQFDPYINRCYVTS